ncbi:aspartate aminotransferase [Thermosipho africanus Ob7]|uniref:pyridoxal-phosphate-dependent aminotransferase family protein n=1 Tax=Thermosipho africanus TaxID=2421 RepID=UPI000E0A8066|nr:aminotransferase class V-fold PLP-dependent enzyme [Thermosipho africanus]RDI91271.1 aspartate aminotransferase [Thermosipho africanus Ob7]
MEEEILDIGGKPIPYFRTSEFSKMMFEIEEIFKEVIDAPKDSKFALLTASGTGAMEAAVMNIFSEKDKVLVVNGGTFGDRFAKLCEIHQINYDEIKLSFGEKLTKDHLKKFNGRDYTGLLVNIHETSTGQLYDIELLSEFCRQNNMMFVVDAISSFLADEFSMKKHNVDCVILSSQKALALAPGLSFLFLSNRAYTKVLENEVKSMYFDLKDYFQNMERGQTPFTPAVSIVYQLYAKLKSIKENGVESYILKSKNLAQHFRESVKSLVKIPDYPLSNALTPILVDNAFDIFLRLKEEGIYVTPSGGKLKDKLLRIGHIGNLTKKDNEVLISYLERMVK